MVTVRNGHPQGCPFHFSVRGAAVARASWPRSSVPTKNPALTLDRLGILVPIFLDGRRYRSHRWDASSSYSFGVCGPRCSCWRASGECMSSSTCVSRDFAR